MHVHACNCACAMWPEAIWPALALCTQILAFLLAEQLPLVPMDTQFHAVLSAAAGKLLP